MGRMTQSLCTCMYMFIIRSPPNNSNGTSSHKNRKILKKRIIYQTPRWAWLQRNTRPVPSSFPKTIIIWTPNISTFLVELVAVICGGDRLIEAHASPCVPVPLTDSWDLTENSYSFTCVTISPQIDLGPFKPPTRAAEPKDVVQVSFPHGHRDMSCL